MRASLAIVGSAWLLCACDAAAPPAAQPADVVFVNGVVHALDAADTTATALAVRGRRIVAVGDDAAVRALAGPQTRVVDLRGRTALPGFVDAHSHFLFAGQLATRMVDLNSPPIGTREAIADVLAALAERAAATPPGEWIVGMGYDDTLLAEKRHLLRADLDGVSREHPILAMHISGHLAVANSLALARGGITRDTPQPQGGVIRRDADGEPDGVLEEGAAFGRVLAQVPPLTDDELFAAVDAAAASYLAQGVTTAQNGLTDAAALAQLERAHAAGRLPLRLVAWPDFAAAQRLVSGELHVQESDYLDVGAMKAIADGSIQGYTGYLSQPYHVPFQGDADYRGYPALPRDVLTAQLIAMQAAGHQVAVHGNGDAAIDDILAAYREAQRLHPRADARPIVIHAQMAREDQLDAMAELGVIPSFFVLHTYYWGDRHRDIFMGPERASRMSPARSALERGIPFTLHADTPVVPMSPLRVAWAAVHRISTSGAVIGEAQRIPVRAALRALTLDAARQHFLEDDRGSLEPGKWADLVVLSGDPVAEPAQLAALQVLETWVGGRRVHPPAAAARAAAALSAASAPPSAPRDPAAGR